MSVRLLWLTIPLTVALLGCGQSDTDKARSTVQSYVDGLASKDGRKVCDQLALSVQAAVQQRSKSKTCAAAVERFESSADGRQVAAAFNTAKVDQVNVKGKVASAKLHLTVPGGAPTNTTIPLEKDGDNWKITQAAGG
jgi:hypothetical protein